MLHHTAVDVCGLPFPGRRSSKSVSCTFLNKFFYFFSLHCSLLVPISFYQNCVFIGIILKYLLVIYLSLYDSDVMFMS